MQRKLQERCADSSTFIASWVAFLTCKCRSDVGCCRRTSHDGQLADAPLSFRRRRDSNAGLEVIFLRQSAYFSTAVASVVVHDLARDVMFRLEEQHEFLQCNAKSFPES